MTQIFSQSQNHL